MFASVLPFLENGSMSTGSHSHSNKPTSKSALKNHNYFIYCLLTMPAATKTNSRKASESVDKAHASKKTKVEKSDSESESGSEEGSEGEVRILELRD